MDKTIPFTLPWDNAPVDISLVFRNEAPAGKHGFLTVKNDRFVFEDGTDARFWGTNFNSGACFPSHEHSEKAAARLARFGVNLVRFHQMDAEWSTPNIFQYSKGAFPADTRSLDPHSLDCLDYLIDSLKKNGVYIYLDMLTYRRFRSGDGVAFAEQMGDAAKPYCCFDARLIELQKEFNEQLWTHRNPYTGLSFRDEPAIVLTEVVNETDLYHQPVAIDHYRHMLEKRFTEWAAETGRKAPASPVDFKSADPATVEFAVSVHRDYYRQIIGHLRSIGVRVPVTGTNWLGHSGQISSQAETDFTDSHVYWYDWRWSAENKKFKNRSILGERDALFGSMAACRLVDKPFFVSEWDDPWPNEWRAESVLLMAAVAAFQGWQGVAIHTYRYSTREDVDCIGQPITSDAIGGVCYRGGVFDTFNDPAKFGLFYHAALILRRGDVRLGGELLEIDCRDLFADGKPVDLPGCGPADGGAEIRRMGVRLKESAGMPGKPIAATTAVMPESAREKHSDTGELYRNLDRRCGVIDTPMTKVAYGFLGAAGPVSLTGMDVTVRNEFAVVAVSSLAGSPIDGSENLLVTAVGRADNTGCRYNEDHTVQLDAGHGPIRVEAIEARISIKTSQKLLRVLAINPDGFVIGYIEGEYDRGAYTFEIGGKYASMYYLIQKR